MGKNKKTERTRIVTAKITIIEKIDDKPAELTKKEEMKLLAKKLKLKLKADDVQVTEMKDFLIDK
jgi:hypothetical protein